MHLPALLLFALLAVACFADGRADATQAAARAVVTTPEPFEATFALCDAEPAATGSLLEIKEHVGLTRQNLRGRKSRGTPTDFATVMNKDRKNKEGCKKVTVKVEDLGVVTDKEGHVFINDENKMITKNVVTYTYEKKTLLGGSETVRRSMDIDKISSVAWSKKEGDPVTVFFHGNNMKPWVFRASAGALDGFIQSLGAHGLPESSKRLGAHAANASSVNNSLDVEMRQHLNHKFGKFAAGKEVIRHLEKNKREREVAFKRGDASSNATTAGKTSGSEKMGIMFSESDRKLLLGDSDAGSDSESDAGSDSESVVGPAASGSDDDAANATAASAAHGTQAPHIKNPTMNATVESAEAAEKRMGGFSSTS